MQAPLHRLAAVAALAGALGALALTAAPPASARQPVPATVAAPSAVQLIAFRVVAFPDVVEGKRGGLRVKNVTWGLRAVYQAPTGQQVMARVRNGRRLVDDVSYAANRPWGLGDVDRQSADLPELVAAVAAFREFSATGDLNMLPFAYGLGALTPVTVQPPVVVVQPPVIAEGGPDLVVVQPTPDPVVVAPAPAVRTCEDVLIDKGFHAQHLDECRGVPNACAVSLLDAGHHPHHLDECRGAEPICAETLLRMGHHPHHLDECAGVRPSCAVKLLESGQHPMHLDNCK